MSYLELAKKSLVTTGAIKAETVYDKNTFDNSAVKIHSKKLGLDLWLIKDKEKEQKLINEGAKEPIFTQSDIQKLGMDLSDKTLQSIYDFKKVFPGAEIDCVTYEKNTSHDKQEN